jgi:hypothetical protein
MFAVQPAAIPAAGWLTGTAAKSVPASWVVAAACQRQGMSQ